MRLKVAEARCNECDRVKRFYDDGYKDFAGWIRLTRVCSNRVELHISNAITVDFCSSECLKAWIKNGGLEKK